MKSEFAILVEIWKALDLKKKKERSGLSQPNHILLAFFEELAAIECVFRYLERQKDISKEECRTRIMSFIHAMHKTANLKSKTPREMHYLTRDMIKDLGLPTLLRDIKILAPKKVQPLYEVLIVLNQEIEKSKSGLSDFSPPLIKFYAGLASFHELLLDPSRHKEISDEWVKTWTENFFEALKSTARLGKNDELLRLRVREILIQLDLKDFLDVLDEHVPQINDKGQFVMAKCS